MAIRGNGAPCRTCRHWDQRYPQNLQLGVCKKVSVFTFLDSDPTAIALSVPVGWNAEPVREDGMDLRTDAYFGCVAWEMKTNAQEK